LVCCGDTKVICTASVTDNTPKWLREKNQGWLSAEYGMLPRATHDRNQREATRGKQQGRTQEIQRLIGRCLRSAINLKDIAGYSIAIDCDVIQADGGTRTAAINGSMIALIDAIHVMQRKKWIKSDPLKHLIGAISVGIHQGQAYVDLDYALDSSAQTDMNVVMTESGHFIEIQGTAEGSPFSRDELNNMLHLAEKSIAEIIALQKQSLGLVHSCAT
jgi:ribonuclease PH